MRPADPTAMDDRRSEREQMVERQLRGRGIRDRAVLDAMGAVPRHLFVDPSIDEWAYADVPLPIGEDQTISQPLVVASMLEALQLKPTERALEVGVGSGYATAVLAAIVREVFGVERHPSLLQLAEERLRLLGAGNVRLRAAGDALGWADEAPFDAILVSAAGPAVPASLRAQLAVGGRLVIPVGEHRGLQTLVRVRRVTPDEFREEPLGAVSFVPLVGQEGWPADRDEPSPRPEGTAPDPAAARGRPGGPVDDRRSVPQLVADAAEPFENLDDADLGPLLDRIADARLVLLGEASHGTSEFYRMRARITRELVERRGFEVVALEADWPDASRLDRYVRGELEPDVPQAAFARFPTWMWRNAEVLDFVEWLRDWNRRGDRQVGLFGLDLYSLYASTAEVVRYLDEVDPELATLARHRYGCLSPFESDPAAYGLAALTDRYRDCEEGVVATLVDLQAREGEPALADGRRLLDATQNARVAAGAERYYRAMYYSGPDSWNLRDRHMFDTLEAVLAFHGQASRAVVWAHNSHLGDASATEMAARGELNLGQLVREAYGPAAYLVGFGTDRGTVAAASTWGGAMQVMRVRPSHERSYERVCHESGVPSFLLPAGHDRRLRDALSRPRLERAIGVVYRPDTELQSHYFEARLADQFDEWIWFDETSAVQPLTAQGSRAGLAPGHPFATVDR